MELDIDKDPQLKTLVGFGQTGLDNLGNTCFLNTAIQCLSSIKNLTAYFLSNTYSEDLNMDKAEHELVEEYANLIKDIWRGNRRVNPSHFKKCLGRFYDSYAGFRQNDSAEAYIKLIELLHEGLSYEVEIEEPIGVHSISDQINLEAIKVWRENYENNYSIILKMFYGQFWNRVKCDMCNTISSNYDPFSIINLPINENTNTIFDCISYYVLSEDMDDDNLIHCEKCNKKCRGKKKSTIWRVPPVLTFGFNRFDDRGRKIDKLIEFPTGKCTFSNLVQKPSDKKNVYELVAVGNHEGGLNGGHYWAYGKGTNGNWYEYNDSRVNEIDTSTLVSSNAYYIIYIKRGLTIKETIIS